MNTEQKITKIERLEPDDTELNRGSFDRNPHALISTSLINNFVLRHNWLKISNLENGKSIYRYALGYNGEGMSRETIYLDYNARVELGISRTESKESIQANLKITRPAFFENNFIADFHHANPAIRAAYRLGFISIVLGAIGLAISVISFFNN